jgi:hypothetical protein
VAALMPEHETSSPERLSAFSDGVFAIIITVLVLRRCCDTAVLTLYVRPEAALRRR